MSINELPKERRGYLQCFYMYCPYNIDNDGMMFLIFLKTTKSCLYVYIYTKHWNRNYNLELGLMTGVQLYCQIRTIARGLCT